MSGEKRRAYVFDIQSYSIHDGPGIRTTVFLKGCPLRCRWCQNPESQQFSQELMVNIERCTGCGACAEACPVGAVHISGGKAVTDREKCAVCGACVKPCSAKARKICGEAMSADAVFEKVKSDKIFYDGSGGGVTVSGGEALCFPDFVGALFEKCRESGIHTALDTSGYAPWQAFEKLIPYTDLFLFDIKHMDDLRHRELTGVSNAEMLNNLKRLVSIGKEVYVRIPVIPGMNDGAENMAASAEFISGELSGKPHVALLPYHRLGESKLSELDRMGEALDIAAPDDDRMERLRAIFEERGLAVQIGG